MSNDDSLAKRAIENKKVIETILAMRSTAGRTLQSLTLYDYHHAAPPQAGGLCLERVRASLMRATELGDTKQTVQIPEQIGKNITYCTKKQRRTRASGVIG